MSLEELLNKASQKLLEGNGKEAEELYLKACEMGSGNAAHNLGVLYQTGAPGVKPDYSKFQYWLNVAFESGFEETISNDPEWFRPKT
ncbi:MAG: hypothetical protein K6L81_06445 [Agarilytica sp.]